MPNSSQAGVPLARSRALEVRIAPGPGDDLGAGRRAARVHGLDRGAHFVGAYDALVDQQLADRGLQGLIVAERAVLIFGRGVVMAMSMIVVVRGSGGDIAHRAVSSSDAGSSQCS